MDSKVGLYYTKHYAHGGLKSKKRVQSKRREDLSNHTIQFFFKNDDFMRKSYKTTT